PACTTVTIEPTGRPSPGTSATAWCRLGSNLASDVSIALTPCFASVLINCRSVASTPSITERICGSAASRIACGRWLSARAKLSAMSSMSRAKRVTAYWLALTLSCSPRRRTFSVSASARSSLSFSSTFSAFSAWITSAGWGCAGSVCGISSSSLMSLPDASAEQPADDFGGVVDHRDDAAIIESRGSENADHADDLARRIGVGRRHNGGARQAEQPVFRTDEDAHAVALLGEFEQANQVVLALDVLEQGADALDVVARLDGVEQMRGAAHDQDLLVAVAGR